MKFEFIGPVVSEKMFENVDGLTTDAGVTGKLIAHLGAFGSGELKSIKNYHIRKELTMLFAIRLLRP